MSVATYVLDWHRRRRGPAAGAVTTERRTLYVLPTRAGVVFALLLLVMLLWALNYNASLGFALVFLLAAVAFDAMRQTHDNLLALTLQPPRVEPVFAGQPATLGFGLVNAAPRARYALELTAADGARAVCDVLAGGQRAELVLTRPTARRGRLPFGRVCLATRYPLGLFEAWTWCEFTGAGLVYPAPLGTAPLPGGGGSTPAGRGEAPGDEDFHGLRDYRRGDPATRIAWRRAAARSGLPPVKQFAAPRGDAELWLDWALLPPALDVEARLSQITAWVLEAEGRGLRWGLRLPGMELAPAGGTAHRRAALEALALHATTGRGDG